MLSCFFFRYGNYFQSILSSFYSSPQKTQHFIIDSFGITGCQVSSISQTRIKKKFPLYISQAGVSYGLVFGPALFFFLFFFILLLMLDYPSLVNLWVVFWGSHVVSPRICSAFFWNSPGDVKFFLRSTICKLFLQAVTYRFVLLLHCSWIPLEMFNFPSLISLKISFISVFPTIPVKFAVHSRYSHVYLKYTEATFSSLILI